MHYHNALFKNVKRSRKILDPDPPASKFICLFLSQGLPLSTFEQKFIHNFSNPADRKKHRTNAARQTFNVLSGGNYSIKQSVIFPHIKPQRETVSECLYLLGINNSSKEEKEPFCIFAERRRQVPLVGLTSACCTGPPARHGRGPACALCPVMSARLCTSNTPATARA